MSQIKLNADTLGTLKTLIDNPSQALPQLLKDLAPNARWDLLTQKVGSNLAKTGEAELSLPLLNKSAADDGTLSSDWKWTASVEANATLSLDLLTPEDLQHLPIQPDAAHTLVVYGGTIAAGGQLGANANKLPWGKVGITAGGKRSADLRWYVQAEDNATLLAALADAQRYFVWPHNIQGMLRMAGHSDWFGMEYELDGEAQLAIDVDASAKATGWTFNLDGEQSSVGLSFGVKAGAKASHQSRWKLSSMVEARPQPGGGTVQGLRIKLHDLRQTSRSGSLAFTAGADFSAVAASAERILRAAWPELKKSPVLDALTQPGTVIADKLKGLIDSKLDGDLADLATLLVGGQPTGILRQDLVDKLTFGLADVLDQALGELATQDAQASQAASSWLDQLLGTSAAAGELKSKLEPLVNDAITQATAGLRKAMDDLKAQIVNKAQAEVDAILKPLGELGAQFDKNLDKLNANKTSKAIQDAVKRYSDLRNKVLAALADGNRQKLLLTLSETLTRDTASEAAFEAWFRPDDTITPEADRLFAALCSGQLLTLGALAQAAVSVGAVVDAKGWLLSTASTLSEQRLSLNFFGIQFANTQTWLNTVSVKTDLVTGNLLAATAASTGGTGIVNPWKNRTAKLGVQLALAGDEGAPRQLAATLNGAFTANRENTDRETVQDLLDAYADAVGTKRNDIGLLLDIPSPSDSDGLRRFWKSLTIAVPVALDAQQWAAFASLGKADIERVSLEIALAQFQRAYKADSLFSKDPVGDLREQILAVTNASKADNDAILGYLKLFPENIVTGDLAVSAAEAVGITARDNDIADRGMRRFKAYHRLSATVQAPLRLRTLATQASDQIKALPEQPDPDAVRKQLEPILAKMQAALSPVALVSETWLGIGVLGAKDQPVSWPYASFITTMAKLAGLPVPPGFVPIAQVGDKPAVRLIAAG